MATKLSPIEIIRNNCPEMQPEPTAEEPRLQTLEGIRAVLFDVYGTLFISGVGDISLAAQSDAKKREKLIRQALDDAGFIVQDEVTPIAQLYLDQIQAEQEIRKDQGETFPEVDILGCWEDLLSQLEAYEVVKGKATRERLLKLAILYEVRVNPVSPMPNVLDAIETCHDRGVSLGIISNAQAFTPILFEAFFEDGLRELGFEEILCIYSYEHAVAKPGTKLYEIAAERLQALDGIRPEEVLYLGNDIRNDIWPASKLGFRTGLFAGDARSLRKREDDPDCEGILPDVVLTDLAQIGEILP